MSNRGVLEAFERTVSREAHNLSRWPDLVWQQLHNRLQWEKEPLPSLLGEQERALANKRWIRTRGPFRESRALVRTLSSPPAGPTCCAVAQDNSYIVSGSVVTPNVSAVVLDRPPNEYMLQVWDPETGQVIKTIEGLPSLVSQCVVATDGSYFASGSGDTVTLWEPETGRAIRTFPGTGDVYGVAPDGSYLLTSSSYLLSSSGLHGLKIWDPRTGEELTAFPGHPRLVTRCAISPDGSFFVSASWDGTLKLWEAETGREAATLQAHGDIVRDCAIAPDGRYTVSAGEDGTLKVWWTDGRTLTLEGHTGPVNACAVAPDGSFILSASGDDTLKLWDPQTGQEIRTLRGHASSVLDVAIPGDGSFIVSAGLDDTLKIWDPNTEPEPESTGGHSTEINTLAVAPDGSFLVSGSSDETLKVWDADRVVERRTLESDSGRVLSCAIAPDGSYCVSGSVTGVQGEQGTVQRWDLDSSKGPLVIGRHWGSAHDCAFDPGGFFVVSAGGYATMMLSDPDLKWASWEIKSLHYGTVSACAVAPDGSYILSAGDYEDILKLWDPGSGREPDTLRGHTDVVQSCAVAPDGSFILSASADHTLRIWDPKAGHELLTLRHEGDVFDCAVAPDCSYVISASEDKTVRLWDPGTGEELALVAFPADLRAVAAHPYLPVIFCGDSSGVVHRLDLSGIELGPIIVTAVDLGAGPRVRCPACWALHGLDDAWLGRVIDCPTPTCHLRLRVNPFVVTPPTWLPDRTSRDRAEFPLAAPADDLARKRPPPQGQGGPR